MPASPEEALARWRAVIDTNLTGAFLMSQVWRRHGGGRGREAGTPPPQPVTSQCRRRRAAQRPPALSTAAFAAASRAPRVRQACIPHMPAGAASIVHISSTRAHQVGLAVARTGTQAGAGRARWARRRLPHGPSAEFALLPARPARPAALPAVGAPHGGLRRSKGGAAGAGARAGRQPGPQSQVCVCRAGRRTWAGPSWMTPPASSASAPAVAGWLGEEGALADTMPRRLSHAPGPKRCPCRVNTVLPGWIDTSGDPGSITPADHAWHPAGAPCGCWVWECMRKGHGSTCPVAPCALPTLDPPPPAAPGGMQGGWGGLKTSLSWRCFWQTRSVRASSQVSSGHACMCCDSPFPSQPAAPPAQCCSRSAVQCLPAPSQASSLCVMEACV